MEEKVIDHTDPSHDSANCCRSCVILRELRATRARLEAEEAKWLAEHPQGDIPDPIPVARQVWN
jgi:hypothetical protein